jgi:hypothetical protein
MILGVFDNYLAGRVLFHRHVPLIKIKFQSQ